MTLHVLPSEANLIVGAPQDDGVDDEDEVVVLVDLVVEEDVVVLLELADERIALSLRFSRGLAEVIDDN